MISPEDQESEFDEERLQASLLTNAGLLELRMSRFKTPFVPPDAQIVLPLSRKAAEGNRDIL